MCLIDDGLDSVTYFTLPQFTWDSAFKSTKCELMVIADAEMYQFFEKGIRGGMTFVNKHYVKSNHESIVDTYDPSSPKVVILYVDENNLYGAALSMLLPVDSFEWMTEEEMEAIDWEHIDTEGDIGYTIEVDLLYQVTIHGRTKDLPLAPERLTPKVEWMSDFQRDYFKSVYPNKTKYVGTTS